MKNKSNFKTFVAIIFYVVAIVSDEIKTAFDKLLGRQSVKPYVGNIHQGMFKGDPFSMANATAQAIGDFEEGDFEDGDFEEGDPAYDTATETGELEGAEIGALKRKRKIKAIARMRGNHKDRKYKRKAGRAERLLEAERSAAGKLNPGDTILFVSGKGVIIQSIDEFPNDAALPALIIKGALDRGQLESPGINLIQASSTPSVEFGTSVGASQYYLYPFYVIKLGVSALNGVANQVITITCKSPVLNGTRTTIVITAQLIAGFDGTLTIYPYQKVQGKPCFVYGKVGGDAGTTDEILVTINGLPTGAVASLVVPLSEHPLYKEMQHKVS